MFLNTIFSWFFSVSASENGAKIHVFLLLFKKPSILWKCSKTLAVRTKIKVWTRKKQEKITKKSIPKRTRKKYRKKPLKIRSLLPFGLPKTLQNGAKLHKFAQKNPPQKKSLKKAMGPSWPYRKASFLGPSRTIQLPFQWLVLLHPSIRPYVETSC